MTAQQQGIGVTYVGREDPFKDRIYRSGLTFTSGQTRLVPSALAQRFLRHSDVFTPAGESVEKVDAPKAGAQTPVDDTAQLLDQSQKTEDDQREQENVRFALLDQLDSMDKQGLIDWAETQYKQKVPGNLGEAKVRERVKGFVDQYGVP